MDLFVLRGLPERSIEQEFSCTAKNLLGKNWVNGYSINLRNFFGVFKFVNLLFICNFTDQKNMAIGILLINLGTPDSPSVSNVRKYLTQFLNDRRVIDISAIGRFILVNLIIVPFRSKKSAGLYKQIWTNNGSPLLIHGKALKKNYKII